MKISKHVHSCLLIEDQGKTIIIDPGKFTYDEHALDIHQLSGLDYILITHEHFDHMYPPFIHELLNKFPDTKIISNSSVAQILEKEQINVLTTGDEMVSLINSPHEKLWDAQVPQNVVMNICNRLTHPGDSLQFSETREILALPIQAPWGSTTQAVEKALELRPKIIIPIHDWHWKDEVRIGMYKRLEEFFAKHGIEFKNLENETITA